jgi:hypothetical protein
MTHLDHTRRLFLLSSAFVLSGCASSSQKSSTTLPSLVWDTEPIDPGQDPDDDTAGAKVASLPKGVIARAKWAKGNAIPACMNRMRPVSRITVHHDGMSAYTQTDFRSAANRLESIRSAHLRRRPEPFGDIGYHFAIDPSGRVWQARALTWQGAHVRRQNSGNLGIVLLGNYDKQGVNARQQAALVTFIAARMKHHRVPVGRVVTHQELSPTACPGRHLQAFMVTARRGTLA